MNKTTVIELSARLLEIPQEIYDLQIQILEKNQELNLATTQLTGLETSLKLEIANKTDDAGKKVYSNADSREAALIEAKAENLEIAAVQNQIDQLHADVQLKRMKYDFLVNEQKNIRSLLVFFANEVELTL